MGTINRDRLRLDSDPNYKRLSKAEVEALPDGAYVTVIWSGGNGPHDYELATDKWGAREFHVVGEGVFVESLASAFVGLGDVQTAVYFRV